MPAASQMLKKVTQLFNIAVTFFLLTTFCITFNIPFFCVFNGFTSEVWLTFQVQNMTRIVLFYPLLNKLRLNINQISQLSTK